MTADNLAALNARKPLTEADCQQFMALRQTRNLPHPLEHLAEWMLKNGEKGEQKGYL